MNFQELYLDAEKSASRWRELYYQLLSRLPASAQRDLPTPKEQEGAASQELSTLRQRGGQLTAEQVNDAIEKCYGTSDLHFAKSVATELNALLANPWTLITSDPASLPKETDADRNGNVLFCDASDRVFCRRWDYSFPGDGQMGMKAWRHTNLPEKKVEDDGFEKWWEENKKLVAINEYHAARNAWKAALAAQKEGQVG